jgi:DNA-binding transcriptional regulator GbsR (MarR family)
VAATSRPLDVVEDFLNNSSGFGKTERMGSRSFVVEAMVTVDDASGAEVPEPARPEAERLDGLVLAVADAVGAFIEAWGFKSIQGRVWTVLAVSARPLAQRELADLLGVSRSLVSLAISELGDYRLVAAVDDSRNAPYVARLDVWPTITSVLRDREWLLIDRARLALRAAVAEADHQLREGRRLPWDVRRLRLLLAMSEFAQATLQAVLALRMPASSDAFRRWLEAGKAGVGKLQRLAGL